MNGPCMTRTRSGACAPRCGARGRPAGPDFLSGASGTVGGKRGALLRRQDAWLDAREAPRRARLRRRRAPRAAARRVLVRGHRAPGSIMDAARAELLRSRHDGRRRHRAAGHARQVREPQRAARRASARGHDWLLVVDDDVALPRGFLDASCAPPSARACSSPSPRTACTRTRLGR
jgi:hypothetical protein